MQDLDIFNDHTWDKCLGGAWTSSGSPLILIHNQIPLAVVRHGECLIGLDYYTFYTAREWGPSQGKVNLKLGNERLMFFLFYRLLIGASNKHRKLSFINRPVMLWLLNHDMYGMLTICLTAIFFFNKMFSRQELITKICVMCVAVVCVYS